MKKKFITIGENIHTTRVFLKKGKRIRNNPNGLESIYYRTKEGKDQYLIIPDSIKNTQDYLEGRIKHVKIALNAAMLDDGSDFSKEGLNYINRLAERQIDAGADYLDLNVDEVSLAINEQKEAMRWLSSHIQSISAKPVSIDSSNIDIISSGIRGLESGNSVTKGLLNSASRERIEALDIAREHDLRVIVTAAGESGMPESAAERLENASFMIDSALDRGISLSDIFVDPLVFPISVDQNFGNHCIDAIKEIRKIYGGDIHITGGFSNVSFGMPARHLINNVFLRLSIEAGADSAIIDPITSNIDSVVTLNQSSESYRLTEDLLLGKDQFCAQFLKAFRAGKL